GPGPVRHLPRSAPVGGPRRVPARALPRPELAGAPPHADRPGRRTPCGGASLSRRVEHRRTAAAVGAAAVHLGSARTAAGPVDPARPVPDQPTRRRGPPAGLSPALSAVT